MSDITPEPTAEEPTPDTAADFAADTATDTTTDIPPTSEPVAATPEPFASAAPRQRRFSTPVAGGVIAGVVGLGLGAGVVALASGHDDHRGNDRRMSDQQVQTQNPSQNLPGVQGQGGQGGFPGQQGQAGQQGGFLPGRHHDRQGFPGQQGQQGGGFFPPNGGGQPQGRSGGS